MCSYNVAQLAYEAYGDAAEWKAYDGKPMPKWDQLPSTIVDRWVAATQAVLDYAWPWRSHHVFE